MLHRISYAYSVRAEYAEKQVIDGYTDFIFLSNKGKIFTREAICAKLHKIIEHTHEHNHVISENKHGHTHSIDELELYLKHELV